MQITVGTNSLTGTIAAEGVQAFRFTSQSQVQESQAIGAVGVTFYPRGNKKLVITFKIQREHDTAEAAAYFCLQHQAAFPVQDKLTYTTAAGVLSYAGAVAEVLDGDFEGATTTHSYRVTCGGSATSGLGGGLDTGLPTSPIGLSLD